MSKMPKVPKMPKMSVRLRRIDFNKIGFQVSGFSVQAWPTETSESSILTPDT